MPKVPKERAFKGAGGSAGVAHGPAVVLQRTHECPERAPQGRPGEEWAAFEAARQSAQTRVDALLAEANALGGDRSTGAPASTGADDGPHEAAKPSLGIFESYKALLSDPVLVDLVRSDVFNAKTSAGYAVWNAVGRIRAILERVKDPHIAEKAVDLENVRGLLLEGLGDNEGNAAPPTLVGAVVVAPLLSPQDLLKLVRSRVAAIVCEQGSPNSHVAILARNFNIPAVVGAKGALAAATQVPGMEPVVFLVDGTQGQVIANPTPETLRKFEARKAYWKMLGKELHDRARLPALTRDGVRVEVLANADSSLEGAAIRSSHADGIGLFRMESFFMARAELPDEDAIHHEIAALANSIPDKTMVVRLLDAGGDKQVPALEAHLLGRGLLAEPETLSNPMGLRGVRILLREPGLLATQCRALVRANVHGNVRVMIPFVTAVEEVEEVRRVLTEAWLDVSRVSLGSAPTLPELGVMIETPAAASLASLLACESSFLSVGTNDLTQHTLVVDRTSAEVTHLYESAHPALLRLLASTVGAASEVGVPVSLCGEMASDPLYAELLVGLGFRQLSCSPHAVPAVKEAVRTVDVAEAQRFVEQLRGVRTSAEFRIRLQQRFADRFSGEGGPMALVTGFKVGQSG